MSLRVLKVPVSVSCGQPSFGRHNLSTVSRPKDAWRNAIVPGIFNARTPGKLSATRPAREIHFAGLVGHLSW